VRIFACFTFRPDSTVVARHLRVDGSITFSPVLPQACLVGSRLVPVISGIRSIARTALSMFDLRTARRPLPPAAYRGRPVVAFLVGREVPPRWPVSARFRAAPSLCRRCFLASAFASFFRCFSRRLAAHWPVVLRLAWFGGRTGGSGRSPPAGLLRWCRAPPRDVELRVSCALEGGAGAAATACSACRCISCARGTLWFRRGPVASLGPRRAPWLRCELGGRRGGAAHDRGWRGAASQARRLDRVFPCHDCPRGGVLVGAWVGRGPGVIGGRGYWPGFSRLLRCMALLAFPPAFARPVALLLVGFSALSRIYSPGLAGASSAAGCWAASLALVLRSASVGHPDSVRLVPLRVCRVGLAWAAALVFLTLLPPRRAARD